MWSAILSPFSAELTGQLPVITVHPRKCLAAKEPRASEGLADKQNSCTWESCS